MSEEDIKALAKMLLESGDIKVYSNDGELVAMSLPADNTKDTKELDECDDYLRAVEHDFRDNADAILEQLQLSHLHASFPKEDGRRRAPVEALVNKITITLHR
jgi:hypothetical protein